MFRPIGYHPGAGKAHHCMTHPSTSHEPDVVLPEQSDRRGGDRRQYNRRLVDQATPPYYRVFERIAVSLEQIERNMRAQEEEPRGRK